jgi:4-hydroxy-3-polyprenylbenzoate decarboxylase
MEADAKSPSKSVSVRRESALPWHDLRGWVAQIEQHGELARISAEVDPHEELGAVTLLASRQDKSPALMFQNLKGDTSNSRILINMLGASRERYALAVGLNPSATTPEMIQATRSIMNEPIPPVMVPKDKAPVNEVVLTGKDIDLTKFPVPTFWPGDGGQFIGTGDITFTASPDTGRINVGCYRQMLQGPNRIGLYCSPGKHGLLDREAWWARGEPCEVVAAYGVDPVLFMLAAQSFAADESELDVAGGIMGRPVELTKAECVSLPIPANAEFVIEGILRPGDVMPEGPLGEFTGYYGRERSPQPGDGGAGGASPQVADLHPCADGALSVLRDRRLLRHHALGPDPRRSGAHRRARRGRRVFASGGRLGLGVGGRVDAAEVRRALGAGAGARGAVSGRGLLHEVGHRGRRGRRPERF